MKSNKELLNHINDRISAYKKENGNDDALKILNNCKNHISKNIKNQKINNDQAYLLEDYFDTLYYISEYEGFDLDDDLFDYSCSEEMKKLYNYFEETEFLKRVFEKYNIWDGEEFIDEFEDELNDEENPKWYSYELDDYITNSDDIPTSPEDMDTEYDYSHVEEGCVYILADKKKKVIRTFNCYDLAMFYVYKRAYNEFNKDYIEWVLNNPEK